MLSSSLGRGRVRMLNNDATNPFITLEFENKSLANLRHEMSMNVCDFLGEKNICSDVYLLLEQK